MARPIGEIRIVHARAIFAPFVLSGLTFVTPQIGAGNNKTRFWRRDGHEPSLFRLRRSVEMRMSRVHAGGADRFDLLIGQFRRCKAAAALFEALEFLVFLGREEIAGDRTIARYGDGRALREHAIAAEISRYTSFPVIPP